MKRTRGNRADIAALILVLLLRWSSVRASTWGTWDSIPTGQPRMPPTRAPLGTGEGPWK
jgi:hypothetical protein